MIYGDWLGRRARLSPERVALYDAADGLRPITYAAWDAAANRTARLLAELGVRRGDPSMARGADVPGRRWSSGDPWQTCTPCQADRRSAGATRLSPGRR